MTEIARDLLLSDEPGKAYRLIANNLIGDYAIEAALAIMMGTHNLIGDSSTGLELVEAEDTEELRRFKHDYNYIYAGRFRSGRGWWRPVAKVVKYGPRDAQWASDQTAQGIKNSAQMRAWGKKRAEYYTSSDERVELLNVPPQEDGVTKMYIVWEPCSEAPHWVRPPASFQEALDKALAAGRLLDERPSAMERELEDLEVQEDARERARALEFQEKRAKFLEDKQREYEQMVASIGPKVREQAGNDTFGLELEDGRTIQVPRAPFVRWALARTEQRDQAPEWENVSPSGLKLQMDNPDHTDWVLGAGVSLDEAYKDNVNRPAWDKAGEFQEQARQPKLDYPGIRAAMEMLSNTVHKAAIVVDAGERTGVVGQDIAVFPDSDADRAKQLDGIDGVIVEKGAKLAHFAIVSKGKGITVMRHSHACETFKNGARVHLSPKTGRVTIVDEDE